MAFARGAWFLCLARAIPLPRVSHDIVGEGVNFQLRFKIFIFDFNCQFKFF